MTPDRGETEMWFISRDRSRLLKVESVFPVTASTGEKAEKCCDEPKVVIDGAERRVAIMAYFSDYRSVDGVLMPFGIVAWEGGQTYAVLVESVEHNVKLASDRFFPPPEVQTLLETTH